MGVKKFWMLLVDGTRQTSYRHYTPESAIEEAKRLAVISEKGVTVLEAVYYVVWSAENQSCVGVSLNA